MCARIDLDSDLLQGLGQGLLHGVIPGQLGGRLACAVGAVNIVGCLANGKSLKFAVELSSDFANDSIARTAREVEDRRYGLNFEAETFSFLLKLNG